MSKSVLISIKPEWCEKIASGEKTIEIRKTKPKLETPFKVYIYCTKGKPLLKTAEKSCFIDNSYKEGENLYGLYELVNGKVIGEFVCDSIIKINYNRDGYGLDGEAGIIARSCVPEKELYHYLQGKTPYLWHISDLVIYDKPRELNEFSKPCICEGEYEGKTYCNCLHCDLAGDSDYGIIACDRKLTRPPQSWAYVIGEEDSGNV